MPQEFTFSLVSQNSDLSENVAGMELGRLLCPNQWLLDIGYVANASIIFDDVKDDCTSRCFKVIFSYRDIR